MGNKQAKESDLGLGHPRRFYDGCTAVQEGCYTISETYFNQAMARHPGHAFWTSLMEVAMVKKSAQAEAASPPNPVSGLPPHSPGTLPSVLKTETELGTTTVFQDGDRGAKRNNDSENGESGVPDNRATPPPPRRDENSSVNDLPSPPSESESVPTLVLPVDQQLVDLQDYVRMLSDMSRIYRLKAATSTGESREMSCRLSMLYNAYTAVRLQALLAVLRSHFATHSTEEGGDDADLFQIYTKRAMESQWGSSALKTELNRKKSFGSHSEVRVDAEDTGRSGKTDGHSWDEDLCMFWQFVQHYFLVNVVSYVSSALRLLRAAENAMSPATQRAVLDMALRSFEVVEQDLSMTAKANAQMYMAALMKEFVAVLSDCTKDCRAKEETVGFERHGRGKHPPRTVKDREVKFLRLGPANLATQQLIFVRMAMGFPVMTLPLLDETKMVAVKLEVEVNGSHHRAVKLMTPVDRPFGWYVSLAENNRSERRSAKPGDSAFLMKKCCVPPGATMRDANFFSCVGLEELGCTLFPLAVARAVVLHAFGNAERAQELAAATNQFALDVYGSPSALSEAAKTAFEELREEAVL